MRLPRCAHLWSAQGAGSIEREVREMPRRKVGIIGAGNVGATSAYYIAEKVIADIVMVDVVEGMPQAKALDFLHAGPMRGYDVSIHGTNDFSALADSDVVVITAGVARKAGHGSHGSAQGECGDRQIGGKAYRASMPPIRR